MTRDLRPAWRVVALLGIAWWLADRWLLAPAPPLVWSLGRDALWGLPVQGLVLAAAALLLARGRSAAFAVVPLLLLVVATLAPAPGVTRAPLALLRDAAALGGGTPSGILAGLSGLLLLTAAAVPVHQVPVVVPLALLLLEIPVPIPKS